MLVGNLLRKRLSRKDAESTLRARTSRDDQRREKPNLKGCVPYPDETDHSSNATWKDKLSATGERFFLKRSRRRRVAPHSDAPSFVGGGARGRARYFLDSVLRLTRDRAVVLLFLALALSYQLRMSLLHVSQTTNPAIAAYRAHNDAHFSPFALLADSLLELAPASSKLAAAARVLRRHSPMLDSAVRACLPGAFVNVGRLVAKLFGVLG